MKGLHLPEGALTGSVIGAFFDVYNTLGFGFLEHVYVRALEWELLRRGHRVAREVGVLVYYKGCELARQRIDMIVDEKVLVETKSTYDLHPDARRQVYNYLRATSLDIGLLLHFGPKPKFYRLILQFRNPRDPLDPRYPAEPSVLDADEAGVRNATRG